MAIRDLRRFSGYVVRTGEEPEEILFNNTEKYAVVALFNRLSVGHAIVINRIDDADPDEI